MMSEHWNAAEQQKHCSVKLGQQLGVEQDPGKPGGVAVGVRLSQTFHVGCVPIKYVI